MEFGEKIKQNLEKTNRFHRALLACYQCMTCHSSPSVLLFCFPSCWTLVACNSFQPGIKNGISIHYSLDTLPLSVWLNFCNTYILWLAHYKSLHLVLAGENQLASWYSRVSFILISTPSTRRKKRSNKKKLVGITLCIIKKTHSSMLHYRLSSHKMYLFKVFACNIILYITEMQKSFGIS